jgi:hypothetical protein
MSSYKFGCLFYVFTLFSMNLETFILFDVLLTCNFSSSISLDIECRILRV